MDTACEDNLRRKSEEKLQEWILYINEFKTKNIKTKNLKQIIINKLNIPDLKKLPPQQIAHYVRLLLEKPEQREAKTSVKTKLLSTRLQRTLTCSQWGYPHKGLKIDRGEHTLSRCEPAPLPPQALATLRVALATGACGHLSPFIPRYSSSTIEWVFE